MIDKNSEVIKVQKFLEGRKEGTIKIEFNKDNIKSEYLGFINPKIFDIPKENKFMNFLFGSTWKTRGLWGLLIVLAQAIFAIIGLITIITWTINFF